MFLLLSSRKEKHNFTGLSSFETFFSFHNLIFEGTTLERTEQMGTNLKSFVAEGHHHWLSFFFLITACTFKRSPALCQGFKLLL